MIVCFQRSRFFGWKKCWVVLERGVLSYFNKRFVHYMTVYNSVYISPPVHTMHQLFSDYTTPKNFENAIITADFEIS